MSFKKMILYLKLFIQLFFIFYTCTVFSQTVTIPSPPIAPATPSAPPATTTVITPANIITPVSQASKEDAVITEEIKKTISTDTRISSTNIDIKTNNGNVSISGTFNSPDEAAAAIEDISSTPGVLDIDTSQVVLQVPVNLSFDDLVISARIKGLFIRDKIFGNNPNYNIDIDTRNGVVFLTGAVNNPAQADQAIDLSQSVPGVKKVIPKIIVKP